MEKGNLSALDGIGPSSIRLNELQERARSSWEVSRNNYTRENFASEFRTMSRCNSLDQFLLPAFCSKES